VRVDLLVTGRTEAIGLAPALTRLFPQHQFQVVLARPLASQPYDGFTSSLLPAPSALAPTNLKKIIEAAISQLVPGRRGDPPDFLFVIDDLELANVHQPQVVVDTFTRAVQDHVNGLDPTLAKRCAAVLSEKASFHLVHPMIEAWFFPDSQALQHAGADPSTALVSAGDPELFHTEDPAYLAAKETDCPCWNKNQNRSHRPKWLGTQRDRHPKAYLQWLCIDPAAKNCTGYQESRGGGNALRQLDWLKLLGRPPLEVQYLRSLIEDLADALQTTPATGPVNPADTAPSTSRHHLPQYPTLRNA